MGQSKDPLDKFKKINKEKAERLEAMGQESDRKAAKWVQEEGKEQRAKEQKVQDQVMEKLDDNKKHVLTYKTLLLTEMKREMDFWTEDLPTGFHWLSQSTDKGIVLWIRNPQGEYYAKGIKLSGEPKYDLNAIARLIVTAVKEMTKQSNPIDDNGIVLPYK